ncbi:MAG: glycosyltransferase family 39 protein [Chthoniobacteraceae bacterium]
MNIHRPLRATLLLAAVLSTLVTYGLARWLMPYRATVEPLEMKGEWIASQEDAEYRTCFRKEFELPGEVRNAWIAVAACDAFELTVNGTAAGRQFLWRPTRPFQNGLSEEGQKLNFAPPILALNYPREYQWEGHRNYQLPTFIDIAPLLRPGRNCVGIEVESRSPPAKLIVDGEIELRTGERIALASDSSWKATALPSDNAGIAWSAPEYSDREWPTAKPAPAPPGRLLRTFDPRLFREAFAAHWIHAELGATERPICFEKTWHLDAVPRDAWIRLLTNRAYDVSINGHRVATAASPNLDAGDWLIDAQPAADLPSMPELLDPDEVDAMTRKANAAAATASATAHDIPKALATDRQVEAFNLYDVRWMLRRGGNRIAVRLIPSETITPLNWTPQFAVDGAIGGNGDDGWTFRTQAPDGSWSAATPASIGPAANVPGVSLPQKNYRGCAIDVAAKGRSWLLLLAAVSVMIVGGSGWWASRHPRSSLTPVLLLPVTVLASAMVLEIGWAERHEALVFMEVQTWAWMLAAAVAAAAFAAAGNVLWRRGGLAAVTTFIGALPETPAWRFILVCLLLGCGFLRAYKVDFQPLDDDEYASTQAVFAIAEHGVPKYTDQVFYTRSPLYHYITGAVVKVFGENLWAVRLPSVVFAVATALLLYLCGSRLLRSRWLGLAALALYAIHPFAIYSAHLGRFYQQQQFFAFLTIYFFVSGMVTGQSMRARYSMLAAFLAAVLSQEMSVVLLAPIAIGHVLFAQRKPARDEVKFFAAAICVIAVIGIDIAIFQTRCLTRTEGVSPNVEATLSPNFSNPMNFFTTFIACSRLHLVLSILLAMGLPFAFRERDRNVIALYFMLFAGVIFTNLLVTSTSPRYQYWLLPLWILLGLHGLHAFLRFACSLSAGSTRQRWLEPALAGLLFATVVLSWSPWRLARSYDAKLVGDSTSAFRYVSSQLRPGDAIAATEPHPHAALLEAGRVDYDLSVPLLHDFVYEKDGQLIDRNGGAEAIGNVTQLQAACAKHERLWVVVNREKFRSRGINIRWEYPGARVEQFLRTNLQVKYRSYLWTAYLWDANRGMYSNLSNPR